MDDRVAENLPPVHEFVKASALFMTEVKSMSPTVHADIMINLV